MRLLFITPYVDDVRPHIARAAAIVSTPLGAEGIDVVSGRDALIGDDADALVEHLESERAA